MAYAKQTWTNDDPATPVSGPRLTHMEKGIEDAHTAIDALPAPLALGATASTAAAGNHTHTIANVSGLQAALDAKGTSNLALGTTATTALKGDTVIPAAAAAGSAAQLAAGTDTAQRTWSAKMIADYVAAQIAAIPPA